MKIMTEDERAKREFVEHITRRVAILTFGCLFSWVALPITESLTAITLYDQPQAYVVLGVIGIIVGKLAFLDWGGRK